MNALRTILSLVFLLLVFVQQGSANQGKEPTVCKPLPSDIQRQLGEKFGSWKIQETKDLSTTARERWKSEKPQECPGIAVGRFADGATLSYAVLLVPNERSDAGYKFLVFNPTPGKS